MKTNLRFSMALEALSLGKKVTKADWNKDEFIWLKPATKVKSEWCKDEQLKLLAEQNGGEIYACNTICKYLFKNSIGCNVIASCILTGWMPSQKELFDQDWIVLD